MIRKKIKLNKFSKFIFKAKNQKRALKAKNKNITI